LALARRLEHLKLKEVRSVAKVIGTLVTFGGALLMAIYKGPAFNLFHSGSTTHHENGSTSHNNHQMAGAIYILKGCMPLSCFYILQVLINIFFNKIILLNACLIPEV